jgi:hypothetical protein
MLVKFTLTYSIVDQQDQHYSAKVTVMYRGEKCRN